MSQHWQASQVGGEQDGGYRSGRDTRVRDGGRHLGLRRIGLAVLGAAVLGGGGAVAYRALTVDTSHAVVSDAVGRWQSGVPGSAGGVPSTLDVAEDGAFALVVTGTGDFPGTGEARPPANLNCRGSAASEGGHLVLTTTAGPCGAMAGRVVGDRIDLVLDWDRGRQALSLARQ